MKASFDKWVKLHRLCIADLPRYGDFPAVYAIRECTTKDILKYGCTGQLCQRIFSNFIGGFGGKGPTSTTQFVHAELCSNGMIERVELAWIETSDAAEAERMEKQFRQEYKRAHGSRPIWDRQD